MKAIHNPWTLFGGKMRGWISTNQLMTGETTAKRFSERLYFYSIKNAKFIYLNKLFVELSSSGELILTRTSWCLPQNQIEVDAVFLQNALQISYENYG